jgi:hypothetical protein
LGLGGPSDFDEEVLDLLHTYPDEDEGRAAFAVIAALPSWAAAQLGRYAHDEVTSRSVGIQPGLVQKTGRRSPAAALLEELGLTEVVDSIGSDRRPLWALSDRGRHTVRILTGRGPMPEWLLELVNQQVRLHVDPNT